MLFALFTVKSSFPWDLAQMAVLADHSRDRSSRFVYLTKMLYKGINFRLLEVNMVLDQRKIRPQAFLAVLL